MDKLYWEEYYRKNKKRISNSNFSFYVNNKYFNKQEIILELGCGDGADSIYFANFGHYVIAVDQVCNDLSYKNIIYKNLDFTKLNNFGFFTCVYSRFTLHSIDENSEDDVLAQSYNNLMLNGIIAIEARGLKNSLYGLGQCVNESEHSFIYNNHYRRFITLSKLERKLENIGFSVIESKEDIGFAPYNGEDDYFFRVIAKKK